MSEGAWVSGLRTDANRTVIFPTEGSTSTFTDGSHSPADQDQTDLQEMQKSIFWSKISQILKEQCEGNKKRVWSPDLTGGSPYCNPWLYTLFIEATTLYNQNNWNDSEPPCLLYRNV